MSNSEDFYAAMDVRDSGAIRITRGNGRDLVTLKSDGDRLLVVVAGEVTGEALTECFQSGVDQKVLRPHMCTLVDLTGFVGMVDWSAISRVSRMLPWGEGGEGRSRIAYLVRDDNFAPLIKIVTALFETSSHRAFVAREAAVAWLEMP